MLLYLLSAFSTILGKLSAAHTGTQDHSILQQQAAGAWCSRLIRPRISLVWTTSAKSFKLRNSYTIESLFYWAPCARVTVFSNTLPKSHFKRLRNQGFDVNIVKISALVRDYCRNKHQPGCIWLRDIASWRKTAHFGAHFSDVIRMIVMLRYGGSYFDFDHILLRDVFDTRTSHENVFGTEICEDHNPDCFSGQHIQDYKFAEDHHLTNGDARRSHFAMRGVRYTPCNGVLLNWRQGHSIFQVALENADRHYRPECWGCLGPQLFGSLLLNNATSWVDAVRLLPPGVLYAFDWRIAADAMVSLLPASSLYYSESYGIHLYGKLTSTVAIVADSTVGHAIEQNTFSRLN